MHMKSRKVVLVVLFAGQQWRHKHGEQACGHSGRWRGGDRLRQQCGNIHITTCKTDSKWEFAV